MESHFSYCATLVRKADSDRYLATLFAPAGKRDALFALYAFDVEMSRVRDLAREPMPGEIRLQWWREVLLGERAGEAAANPVAGALLEILSRHNLASGRLIDLIEAHRFDVYNEPISSLKEFYSYAARTAGVIFELAAQILAGDVNTIVAGLTAEAGNARTISYTLTQLPRHAARWQLYVPLEILRHHGAEPDDVFAMRATPELRAALAELRLRACRHLALIGAACAEIPKSVQPVFLVLAPLRQWLLDMERRDYDPFRPSQVSPWRRQWHIWRAARSFERIGA